MKLLATCLVALAAGCAATTTPEPPSAPLAQLNPADTQSFVAERVAPGIHVLYQPGFHIQPRGNVVVFEQRDGVILVDTGGSPSAADEVVGFVRRLTRRPVKAIVLTHWHGDHILGAQRLMQEWPGARLVATRATADILAGGAADRYLPGDDAESNARLLQGLADGVSYLEEQARNESLTAGEREGYRQGASELVQYQQQMRVAQRVVPTEAFTDRLLFDDPVTPVEVMFLGAANTQGDAVIWAPRQRVLATGDIIVRPIPYGFNVYPEQWINVLNRIRDHDAVRIIPGHGAPLSDDTYIVQLIESIASARAQAAAIAADPSVTSQNVAGRIDLSQSRDYFVGDDAWMRRWYRGYWTNPLASSVLREARGEPIEQGAP